MSSDPLPKELTAAPCESCGGSRKLWPFRFSPNVYVPCPDCTGYTGPGSELCGAAYERMMDRRIYGVSFVGPDGERIDPNNVSPA